MKAIGKMDFLKLAATEVIDNAVESAAFVIVTEDGRVLTLWCGDVGKASNGVKVLGRRIMQMISRMREKEEAEKQPLEKVLDEVFAEPPAVTHTGYDPNWNYC